MKMDSIRLESLKNKDEHAQSAIASQEVREHLAGFLRSKRGSSTQINSLVSSSSSSAGQQQQQQQQSGGVGGQHNQIEGQQHDALIHCGTGRSASSSNQDNDDHPLRKTASMPTMHIPYKAQSLSRRRQIERRITMSPLMKRKSRPRRQLLYSLETSGVEYSSNPCILQSSGSNTSPPPQASTSSSNHSHALLRHPMGGGGVGGRCRGGHLDLMMKSSSQSHLDRQLRMCALGRLTAIDDDLGDSLKTQHMRVQEALRKTVLNRASSRAQLIAAGGSLDSAEMSAAKLLEVKKLLEASSPTLGESRSNSLSGAIGSSNTTATTTAGSLASLATTITDSTTTTSTATPATAPAPVLATAKKEESRQWSLDATDLRASLNARQAAAAAEAAANRTLAWGSLFHREFHRLKLATTSDAATLRRSKSPISSISLGLSRGSTAAIHQLQQKAKSTGTNQEPLRQLSARVSEFLSRPIQTHLPPRTKHYSSSSSSLLLSAQDSHDDSSSQAIDLSSSSEVDRQRHHLNHRNSTDSYSSGSQHSTTSLSGQLGGATLDKSLNRQRQQQQQQQQQHFNYQKVLQDSFNQLQLCHHQSRQGMKHVLLPSTHSSDTTQLEHYHSRQQHPMLGQLNAKTQALSLDIPTANQQRAQNEQFQQQQLRGEFFTSLTQQFNLSASAQNLISLQEQQQVHSQINSFLAQQQQQQQQDLNHWLMAYNNLIQSAEFQQSNQITSSLLIKMTSSLPEPYKSALLSQLLIQQQQQQRQQAQMSAELNAPDQPQSFQQQTPDPSEEGADSSKLMIGRALSSPMLFAANSITNHPKSSQATIAAASNIETPMQAVEFELGPSDNNHDNSHTRQRMDVQMIAPDTDEFEERAQSPPAAPNLRPDSNNNNNNNHNHNHNHNHTHQQEQQHLTSLDLSLSSKTKTSIEHDLLVSELLSAGQKTGSVSNQPPNQLAYNLMLHQQQDFGTGKISCNFLYNPVFDSTSSTGLVYELELCNHKCICNNENNHPENSFRVLAIWRRLYDSGLMAKCARIESRRATLNELQLCHGETYSNYFGRSPYERIKLRQLDLSKLPIEGLTQLECGGQGADIDTAWNEEQTPGVARLAVGCVIEAAVRVANGQLLNAFALVRPPGHHAEYQQAMGFCFFNSLAIAARVLLTRHQLNRILIVDWDVHHGNGLQKMFYEDKSVMYISLHRHDKGNFFPGTGDPKEVGLGPGEGCNWNVAWSGEIMGDAEYLAAFRSLVMPLARDFNPSMVLVACGFDGASGHPFNFGGYELSPACFAHMTSQLMSLANGRLVLCLEGGYQLGVICDCAEACLRALLRDQNRLARLDSLDQLQERELKRVPNESAREVLHELSSLAAKYWPNVARWRDLIDVSALEATNKTM